jgi:hypothetical protein
LGRYNGRQLPVRQERMNDEISQQELYDLQQSEFISGTAERA